MQRILLTLVGVVIGFVLASAARSAWFYYEDTYGPPPPHPHIGFLIQATAVDPSRIDFTTLNDGAWRWLCLFGPRTEPLPFITSDLSRRGHAVSIPPSMAALFGDGSGTLGPGEGAFAVLDEGENLSIVRFSGLEPVAKLERPICTDKQTPVVSLAAPP